MAGVPLPALVLPVAWMSEKPGSVWKGDVNQASEFEFAVADELAARGTRYGWLARAMLVAIGKRSSAEVITDRTTIKGAVCRTVFGRLYEERVLSESQGVWARSVVWAGFETRDAWHPEASVHGVLRTRTLVGGPYEVGVLNAPGRFEAGPERRDDPSVLGQSAWLARTGNGTPLSATMRTRLLESWSWDRIQPVRDEWWGGQTDTVVAMVADPFAGAAGPTWFTVWYESVDPNDPYIMPGRPIGLAGVPISMVWKSDALPTPLNDQETGDWLAGSLRVRLVPELMRVQRPSWRSMVRLEWTGAADGDPITFGGQTSVVLRRADQTDLPLMAGSGCWFRAEPGGTNGPRIMTRIKGISGYVSSPLENTSWVLPAPMAGDRLVVRFEPEPYIPHRSVFADLEADRVYLGVVEVELEDWTVEEINRLRVSGVWPDHAMRE
jgi:hypothetical protein